jgi:hypothetical protein
MLKGVTVNRFGAALTAVLLASTLGCGGTTNRTSVLSPTQSAPPQPPEAHGLMTGIYEGNIPSIRISFNGGPPDHITRLTLRQDGPNVVGQWLEVDAGGDDTGGTVIGTFDSPAGDPGTFGRLTLALTSADFAIRIEAKITSADGNVFVGDTGECTDWTCATFWPQGQRDTVTFTRTGPNQ